MLKKLLGLFSSIFNPVTQGNNRLILYAEALKCLGTDASPNDVAPDSLACMETIDTIFYDAFGHYINGTNYKVTVSTYEGYKIMSNSPYFTKVDQPLEGDVLVYATGEGNGNLSNGHIFIVNQVNNDFKGKTLLMSNNSDTGKFLQNYTLESAKDRYEKIGGYKPHWFRVV